MQFTGIITTWLDFGWSFVFHWYWRLLVSLNVSMVTLSFFCYSQRPGPHSRDHPFLLRRQVTMFSRAGVQRMVSGNLRRHALEETNRKNDPHRRIMERSSRKKRMVSAISVFTWNAIINIKNWPWWSLYIKVYVKTSRFYKPRYIC